MLENAYKKICKGNDLSKSEALYIAKNYTWQEIALFSEKLRIKYFQNKISICTIINAKSGACDMDCKFCSQSKISKSKIDIYPLVSSDKIEKAFLHAKKSKARNCGIVTSGGKLDIRDIKNLGSYLEKSNAEKDLNICASLGRLDKQDLEFLKKKGIKRIHHNLETSKEFYKNICSTQQWEKRLDTVLRAKALGFEICCGGLFGIGESWEDRISLAITLRQNNITDIPVNFLVPHENTPLQHKKILSPDEALKIISILRLLIPKANLRICGGRRMTLKDKEKYIFKAGANALMTGDYLTAKGNKPFEDLKMIQELGLEVTANE